MKHRTRRAGQAIVEFALTATLIFFLLCAAIDLGLIFFAVQGLHNAAQEGGTYGSRWLVTDGSGKRVLNAKVIKDKVRLESGNQGGIGFVNLLDLNGDGIDDKDQSSSDYQSGVLSKYITVQMLSDSPDFDGDPLNNGTAPDYSPCENAATAGPGGCYAYVVVRANHNLVFPLSPVFTDTIQLKSSFTVPIRDSYSQGDQSGPPPVVTTPGPTPDPDSIVLEFVGNTSRSGRSDTKFQFTAKDTAVGNTDGAGISNVTISVAGNAQNTSRDDPGAKFCAYDGNCGKMSQAQWDTLPAGPTTFVITATATSTSGNTKPLTVTVTVTK